MCVRVDFADRPSVQTCFLVKDLGNAVRYLLVLREILGVDCRAGPAQDVNLAPQPISLEAVQKQIYNNALPPLVLRVCRHDCANYWTCLKNIE